MRAFRSLFGVLEEGNFVEHFYQEKNNHSAYQVIHEPMTNANIATKFKFYLGIVAQLHF